MDGIPGVPKLKYSGWPPPAFPEPGFAFLSPRRLAPEACGLYNYPRNVPDGVYNYPRVVLDGVYNSARVVSWFL
jgi:hypothetical protein